MILLKLLLIWFVSVWGPWFIRDLVIKIKLFWRRKNAETDDKWIYE